MKKVITTTLIRDIHEAKGRFLSIILLIFISTFTLVGLYHVGPTIRETGDQYFDQYNLADFSIISTYGLTEEEQRLITDSVIDGAVEFGYMQDVTIKNTNDSVRLFSQTENISKYEIVDGTMPTTTDQIAINKGLASKYPIGSTIEFKEKGQGSKLMLRKQQFEVVGYVNSVEIISPTDMGTTKVGNGLLNGYGVVSSNVFDSNVYTIARITFNDLKDKDTFTKDYQTAMVVHKNQLKMSVSDLPEVRLKSVQEEAKDQVNQQEKELDETNQQLEDTKKQLDDASLTLSDTKSQLDAASSEVTVKEQQFEVAKVLMTTKETELKNAQTQLDAAQKQLSDQVKSLDKKQVYLNAQLDSVGLIQVVFDQIEAMIGSGDIDYEEILRIFEENSSKIDEILTAQQLLPVDKQEIEDIKNSVEEQILLAQELDLSVEDLKVLLDTSRLILEDTKITLNNLQLELDKAYATASNAQINIDTKYNQIKSAKDELALKQQELVVNEVNLVTYKNQIATGYDQYNNGMLEYLKQLTTYNQAVKQIAPKIDEGYEQVEEQKLKIDNLLLPVYTISSRSQMPTSSGYNLFTNLATAVDKVASIFPILLYAVAALVTYTNMSRYVEDQRSNIGTLFALGYQESTIKRKYVIYGLVSSSIGACLGIIIGSKAVPELLYASFRSDFTTPDLLNVFSVKVALIALLSSILCAVIPALIVTNKEFKASPSNLMLPKPPSIGSTIFLERITPIWNRFSFDRKVTARNIFRNKKRMFMTIFGVSGSVALLFTGLALQGSIGNISEIQFEEILNYDMVIIEEHSATIKQKQVIEQHLDQENVSEIDGIYLENLHIEVGAEQHRQNITMMVGSSLQNYVDLRDRKSEKKLAINPGEVLVSEHLARITELEIGDEISVYSQEGIEIKLKVGGIIEMYANHFIFATEDTYKAAFGKEPPTNAHILTLNEATEQNVENLAIEMLKIDGVQSIIQNANQISQVNKISRSLNAIMSLLSLLSVLLALVILYNITNINVTERMYELSTTKVLGYFDKEVTLYIYRETIILSVLGIGMGYVVGNLIHKYMMVAIAPYNLMFDPRVTPGAYVYPALLIIIATIVLGIMLHIRLKSVDMLEALKSNE